MTEAVKAFIEKVVSVYQQRVLCLTIPKKIAKALKIEKGSLVKWYYEEGSDSATITNVSKNVENISLEDEEDNE